MVGALLKDLSVAHDAGLLRDLKFVFASDSASAEPKPSDRSDDGAVPLPLDQMIRELFATRLAIGGVPADIARSVAFSRAYASSLYIILANLESGGKPGAAIAHASSRALSFARAYSACLHSIRRFERA